MSVVAKSRVALARVPSPLANASPFPCPMHSSKLLLLRFIGFFNGVGLTGCTLYAPMQLTASAIREPGQVTGRLEADAVCVPLHGRFVQTPRSAGFLWGHHTGNSAEPHGPARRVAVRAARPGVGDAGPLAGAAKYGFFGDVHELAGLRYQLHGQHGPAGATALVTV